VQQFAIEWGDLLAVEPYLDEVLAHAPALVAAYNDPRNAPLLGHTALMIEPDVIEHYEQLYKQAAHPFLLFRNGALAGDGDIRGVAGGIAEFAFLIASPDAQGQGLGTRFATMVHTFAFARLALARMYAAVVPNNVASRRVFEKLGYREDHSDTARSFADPNDVTLSIDRETFEQRNAAAVAEIRIAAR
jgi:RimJ/RimL family protein N-acetyltransferase